VTVSVRLETERLILRLPELGDAAAAAEHLTDPEAMRFIGIGGRTVAPEDCAGVVRRWIDRWEANGFGQFALERRGDGRFLGRAGLLVWDAAGADGWEQSDLLRAADPRIELGWTLAREHWGRGYATEAALAVRDWAYGELGLERLISIIHPDNAASQAVARRLGAVPGERVATTHGPAVVWVHPR
jgi:RimJ/RimL family protein N-acetyltransferase